MGWGLGWGGEMGSDVELRVADAALDWNIDNGQETDAK